MAKFVTLKSDGLNVLREMNPRLVSYNVEMTEVTGGTFWKAYTPEQVDGTEEFPPISDWRDMGKLQQWYDPIDLTNPRIRALAKELGTAWVRVSGTWANKTYYDFDGHTNGVVPEGYQNLLTKQQWLNLLDFAKEIDAKVLVSVANCPGLHKADEPWPSHQAELLFKISKEYGVPIAAAEFTNEPNMMMISGLPLGYTAEDHARDHDLFGAWLRENYPECLFVGPCTVGDIEINMGGDNKAGGGIASAMQMVNTKELLGENKVKMDVFSYHYYNGISERGASMGGHWDFDKVLSDEYLTVAADCAKQYVPIKEKYVPGGEMWVTESGDAGCGGNTWASTYADVPRTLNELGEFCTVTNGVIFHNTLASSDYGFLKHGTFEPRPNYFAVLLWNRLMGSTVYDCRELAEGSRIYAHSRKDGKEGTAYLVVNNSNESLHLNLPKEAELYLLHGQDKFRSRVMTLNGKPLVLSEDDELPELTPVRVSAAVEVPSAHCAFVIL